MQQAQAFNNLLPVLAGEGFEELGALVREKHAGDCVGNSGYLIILSVHFQGPGRAMQIRRSTTAYAGICPKLPVDLLGQIWGNLIAKPCHFRPFCVSQSSTACFHKVMKNMGKYRILSLLAFNLHPPWGCALIDQFCSYKTITFRLFDKRLGHICGVVLAVSVSGWQRRHHRPDWA